MREHRYWVYILTSNSLSAMYIGVTNDLQRRVEEHRSGEGSKFTRKHKVFSLVWYEIHHDINAAIQRETSLKKWKRDWKTNLIERENPHWRDLYPGLVCDPPRKE